MASKYDSQYYFLSTWMQWAVINFRHCHLVHPSLSHRNNLIRYGLFTFQKTRTLLLLYAYHVVPGTIQNQHSPYCFMDAFFSISICSRSSITSLGVTELVFPSQEIRMVGDKIYTSNVLKDASLFRRASLSDFSSPSGYFPSLMYRRSADMWIFPYFQLPCYIMHVASEITFPTTYTLHTLDFTQSQYNHWHQLI